MSRGRTTAALLLVAFSLCCGAESSDVRIPPDESLTLDEYTQLGIPKIEHDWSRDERATARSVLRELAEQEPTHLPRLASERSGALFEKLIHEEFFRRELLEGEFGEMTGLESDRLSADEFGQMILRDSLMGIYGPESTGGFLFDRELVAMMAQNLARVLESYAVLKANVAKRAAVPSSESPGDDRADRYRKVVETADRILTLQISQLAVFAIAEKLTPEARADATSHLLQQVPRIAPLLRGESRTHLYEVLRECSAFPGADPRLEELLKTQ